MLHVGFTIIKFLLMKNVQTKPLVSTSYNLPMKNVQNQTEPLLSTRNLKKYFPINRGFFSHVAAWVKAVDDVSFDVYAGETIGLVGESGCGKTTVGRVLLRLLEPTAGTIHFEGNDLLKVSTAEMRHKRRQMQT